MEYTATAAYRKPVASRNTTLSASIRMNFRKFRSRRDAAGISARTSPKQAIPATAVIAWASRTGTTSAASAGARARRDDQPEAGAPAPRGDPRGPPEGHAQRGQPRAERDGQQKSGDDDH